MLLLGIPRPAASGISGKMPERRGPSAAHGQSETFGMKGVLPLSQSVQPCPASGIRKMAALAAQYQDAINLTLGEPDFDTPAGPRLIAAS